MDGNSQTGDMAGQVILGPNALRILAAVQAGNRLGTPPSLRDLMGVTGLGSTNAVSCHTKRLRKLGLLSWEGGHGRTLRLNGYRLLRPDELTGRAEGGA